MAGPGLPATSVGAVTGSPTPTNLCARETMRANRRVDTAPERALRSELHRLGLRFRKDFPLQLPGRRVRPDIVFTKAKVAVFVDGCFWHRCPEHGRIPKANQHYWELKLSRNVERDQEADAALTDSGWTVLRFYEHVSPIAAANRIVAATRSPRGNSRPPRRPGRTGTDA